MKNILKATAALLVMGMIGCNDAKENETENHEQAKSSDTIAATTTTTTETKESKPELDSAGMAKAWKEYMTPGEMHKWMESTDGKWEAQLTFWYGEGAPATAANMAKVEQKTILGGRYQESIYKGKIDGMDFEGRGMLAFDNATKNFVSTWVDNMGTGLMYLEGKYDDATKTMNLKGKNVDPVTGEEKMTREVFKVIDEKNHLMEMYVTTNGKEYKSMEIKLAKK